MALKIKKLKNEVSLLGMTPQMCIASIIVAGVFDKHGLDAYITSGTEGVHDRASKHFQGNGEDFSFTEANRISVIMAENITNDCRIALGRDFDVVNEGNHLHIEWDPKQGVNQ